jgi:exosortase E/protease (VPEID-CTERM system)
LSCLIALGILAWVRRSPDLSRDVEANAEPATEAEPSNPTVAYLAPLMVNLALVLVTGAAVASFDLLYPARVWLVAVALAWIGRRHLGMASRAWRPAPAAVVLGVLVVPLWLLLAKSTADGSTALGEALGALSPAARAVWIGARILGMAILAPVTEELAFRGFLLRRLHDADFDQVDYAAAARRPVPLLVSSLAFGAVHGSFLAGTIAGVIYGVALLPRGRLSDAVAAHVVTNAILLLCAAVTSSWAFA